MKKFLLSGVATLAFATLVSAQTTPYYTATQSGQTPGFIVGHTLVGGPVPPPVSFTGAIAVTTVGSFTTGVLTVTQNPSVVSRIILPIGSVITGTGVTAGTSIVSQVGFSDSYNVVTTGGTIAAVSAEPMTTSTVLTSNIQDTALNTAPTYSAGGCTVGPPAFAAGSTAFSWRLTNGTGTCTLNTITLTMPAAPVSWQCTATSTLNGATDVYVSTGAASTTSVVLTDYSTAGVAQPTKANDVIVGTCLPR